MISFKYRIYPNKEQERRLQEILTTCRHTYNNALAERIEKYKNSNIQLSYKDQSNQLANNKNEYQKKVHSQVLQETLKRLDRNFQRFFKGLKKDAKVGFPRFKNDRRFRSFCYPQSGFKIIFKLREMM